MIEHIKNFKEEFKAKYGVEAIVQIKVHGQRKEEEAEKIINDFAKQLGTKTEYNSSDEYNWVDTGKRWGEIEITAWYDKAEKEECLAGPVHQDTIVWY